VIAAIQEWARQRGGCSEFHRLITPPAPGLVAFGFTAGLCDSAAKHRKHAPIEWDETMPGYTGKHLDISFIENMSGDLCDAPYLDGWGRHHECIRVEGHTGRHMAVSWGCNYPVAVWR
jgi:hypothetical protein